MVIGALICEMALGERLFQGNTESEVLNFILLMLVAPDLSAIEDNQVLVLGSTNHTSVNHIDRLPPALGRLGEHGLRLVASLLAVDWRTRTTAEQILQSNVFDTVRPG